MSAPGGQTSRRRGRGPMPPLTGSTGQAASTAATSAGGRSDRAACAAAWQRPNSLAKVAALSKRTRGSAMAETEVADEQTREALNTGTKPVAESHRFDE